MENITFAVFLTAAGAGVAASVITALISVIKTAFDFAEKFNGAGMAFIFSAVLYAIAAFATNSVAAGLDALLGVFIAWLTCATAAVGVHKMLFKPVIEAVAATKS